MTNTGSLYSIMFCIREQISMFLVYDFEDPGHNGKSVKSTSHRRWGTPCWLSLSDRNRECFYVNIHYSETFELGAEHESILNQPCLLPLLLPPFLRSRFCCLSFFKQFLFVFCCNNYPVIFSRKDSRFVCSRHRGISITLRFLFLLHSF